MKASELKEKTIEALHAEQLELQESLFKMRLRIASGQLTRTHELGQVRRNIARIKTVINEKQGN